VGEEVLARILHTTCNPYIHEWVPGIIAKIIHNMQYSPIFLKITSASSFQSGMENWKHVLSRLVRVEILLNKMFGQITQMLEAS
jgi:hypothetical protein